MSETVQNVLKIVNYLDKNSLMKSNNESLKKPKFNSSSTYDYQLIVRSVFEVFV